MSRGWRRAPAARLRRARPPHVQHQLGFGARIERRANRHQPVGRIDAAAGKHEAARQERVTLMALAHQHLGRRPAAVEQDQRRGVLRRHVGMAAHRVGAELLHQLWRDIGHRRFPRYGFLPRNGFSRRRSWRAVAAGALGRPALRAGHDAAFGQKLEAERAGDRRRLDELHRDAVAEPVRLARAVADHGVHGLLVAEIFVADGARRNEAVGAGVVELDEQAGAGDAGDAALEGGADAVGEKMRDQPVVGLALGLHGAALGGGNLRGDLGQRGGVLALGQAVGAEIAAPERGRDARSGRHSGGSAR